MSLREKRSGDPQSCDNQFTVKWGMAGHARHDKVNLRSITLLFLLTVFFSLSALSQDTPVSLTYKSTMIGFGTSSVYDSYLSPLKYAGENVGLYYEQMKNTGLMSGNIAAQHLLNANYSWSKNNSGTASYYTGFFEYNYGLYYKLKPVEKLQVFTGAQAGGLLGFVYNTRNGNNPATGKAHVNLNLSAIANYRLQIRSQPVHIRYQLSVPFIGAMYSPQFGQSYYEISLGVTDNLVHLASFHNYFSVRNMLSAEIPLDWFTLRIAYHFSFYETRINDLDTRLVTNTCFVGLSRNFFVVSGKQKKNNYRYVYE
jgi:hypothetical protein